MRSSVLCLLVVLAFLFSVSAADELDVGDAVLLRLEILGEAEQPTVDSIELVSVEPPVD